MWFEYYLPNNSRLVKIDISRWNSNCRYSSQSYLVLKRMQENRDCCAFSTLDDNAVYGDCWWRSSFGCLFICNYSLCHKHSCPLCADVQARMIIDKERVHVLHRLYELEETGYGHCTLKTQTSWGHASVHTNVHIHMRVLWSCLLNSIHYWALYMRHWIK